MKNNKKHAVFITIGVSLCLVQFSNQDQAMGIEKPRINVFGQIKDITGNVFQAENITISGMYQQITVYIKPLMADSSPSHKIKIDLVEEQSIYIPHDKNNKPIIEKFNNREYIEIAIATAGELQTRNFIIENSKELQFDEPRPNGPLEHSVKLGEVDEIIIKGHKAREEQKRTKKIEKNGE